MTCVAGTNGAAIQKTNALALLESRSASSHLHPLLLSAVEGVRKGLLHAESASPSELINVPHLLRPPPLSAAEA